MELASREILGYFNVPTGQLIVSDPCYPKGVWCMGLLESTYCGRWIASVMFRSFSDTGRRVCRLAIKSERSLPTEKLYPAVAPFVIGVDSGSAGFFDSMHYQGGNANGSFCPQWYNYCRRQTRSSNNAGVITCGVVASTGFGDGEYSCVTYRDNSNLLHMAELIFIVDEIT